MGRYDLRAQRVLANANLALETKRISTPPVWHQVIQDVPPPPRLTRPVKHRSRYNKYKPERITYPEDKLRTEFFSDHPWELARPRVVLEDSGNDHREYDWSELEQDGKRIDGESVVQRQLWLKQNPSDANEPNSKPMSHYRAYDVARKEFYKHRHFEDVERRIAKEEALHTGAYFNIGPNAIAEPLEDAQFEKWKLWAAQRVNQAKNMRMAGYSGVEADDDAAGEEILSAVELEAAEEEDLLPSPEALPQTSQGAVADAVENMDRPSR